MSTTYEHDLSSYDFSKIHGSQVAMFKDLCIEVDENDTPIRGVTKAVCHAKKNIDKGMIHRAFSILLFNTKGELLLQQRSDVKITFPGHYTNTCCSHQSYTPEEMDLKDHIGGKRAVQRRLFDEFGVDPKEIPLDAIHFITRFRYKAVHNELWGEHEIDHVYVAQLDVNLKPNPNEVKSYKYVAKDEILDFLASVNASLTPWFKIMLDQFLFKWWDRLDNLKSLQDDKLIQLVK